MEAVIDLPKVFQVKASGLSVSLSLFLIFLALLYWYSVFPYSVLSQCGIKHPKPSPFLGNALLFHQGFFHPTIDLIKTYGRVCGYYMGRNAVVLVADPDILKQVLVKEFSSFPNRLQKPAFGLPTKPMRDSLLTLRDEQWKKIRGMFTPSFSAAKMKEMVPLINTAIDSLMNNLNAYAESGEAFDIHRCFNCFTMDVTASVAFGTQLDSQKNPNHPFVHHAKMFMSFNFTKPIMLLFIAFPSILAPLLAFLPKKRQPNNFFISSIKKIIKQRDEQPPEQRRRDFLQLMLDARSSQECVSVEHFDMVNHADELDHTHQQAPKPASEKDNGNNHPWVSPTKRPQKTMLTEDEIVGQAFVFFLAGYDTSSNTLGFTCYLMAIHPECQRKVQEEVDQFIARHESPDYTTVQELKYLDMVISEVLRLYPTAFRFGRHIDHDCVVNGLFLPKGALLQVPTCFLHHDPEHWPEPERFIPERFTPEAKANRHPFVYLPFGAGPRNCVGMRLAQMQLKMVLVHVLQRFNIVACSETKVPLEVESWNTLGPKNGIFVKLTRRDMGKDQVNSPPDD
ncbi:thromboxane-A synthase-like [Centroberyx affinis]|uniref:thromboxane-A synthase-like n=1 Tax=Centroberyx affinis TaxID=166261 RepID=UPI003A5BCAA6